MDYGMREEDNFPLYDEPSSVKRISGGKQQQEVPAPKKEEMNLKDAQQTRAQILKSAHENAVRSVHHLQQAIDWLQLIETDTKERYRKPLTSLRELEEHIEELRSVYTSKV